MIVRSGLAISIPVLFSFGLPDGNVSWHLYDSVGTELSSGTVAVPNNSVSINLLIAAALNTLAPGTLFASRDFTWSYTVGGAVINGEQRYDVEARPPFGASSDGVRAKLGVGAVDLPDVDISLIRAYFAFEELATSDAILAASDGGANDLAMRDAIEATAALALIPTMSVRVANSEDSGTNKFKRQDIDWDAVALALAAIISTGILVALPSYDPLAGAGALFMLARPTTDAITGSNTGA
jgi:hypothetical protein